MLALQLVNLTVGKDAAVYQTAFWIDQRFDLHRHPPSVFTARVRSIGPIRLRIQSSITPSFQSSVLVLYHRDCGFNSFSRQLLQILMVNLRWFFLHGDHRPQRIAKPVVAVFRTISPHGKVAHGSLTRIEVTMPHEVTG